MAITDIHPELRTAARFTPQVLVRPRSLSVLRAAQNLQRLLPQPPGVEQLTTADGIRVRLHRPPGRTEPGPALLWIHGGGYLIGTAAQDDRLCRRFADELGATVAAVDYRLAPEHPYPAGVEDCHAALTWLAGLPAVDPDRVAVGGASAGGGLAAALAFLARERSAVTPVRQLLVYPMLDDRSAADPRHDGREYRLWDRHSNAFGWRAYLGTADPDVAVPARRTDLAGLPPAWIGVGTMDLFHDEDLSYAQRLTEAGVPCEVEVVPGAFHGFDGLRPGSAVARSFFESQCASLRSAFGE
ncbi:alpha/beta hydrolase [Mycolicibacterium palauense]|uniref:alpha/beta hydrolase n=1 Tax=Mycolicibacterium palauense TaxID=2034511 RepID=UPI000BFF1893|nr:alpha/beta hydrolase [Mycolicibacterium palauense]